MVDLSNEILHHLLTMGEVGTIYTSSGGVFLFPSVCRFQIDLPDAAAGFFGIGEEFLIKPVLQLSRGLADRLAVLDFKVLA